MSRILFLFCRWQKIKVAASVCAAIGSSPVPHREKTTRRVPFLFLCKCPNFEMLRPPEVVFGFRGVAFSARGGHFQPQRGSEFLQRGSQCFPLQQTHRTVPCVIPFSAVQKSDHYSCAIGAAQQYLCGTIPCRRWADPMQYHCTVLRGKAAHQM